jgi:hypothetical protein
MGGLRSKDMAPCQLTVGDQKAGVYASPGLLQFVPYHTMVAMFYRS